MPRGSLVGSGDDLESKIEIWFLSFLKLVGSAAIFLKLLQSACHLSSVTYDFISMSYVAAAI
jgi:hypothetical protein